jgi:hypothetical protein
MNKKRDEMGERGKGFPRLSLSGAIKIIVTASKFGKTWPKEQFAGFGSQSGAGSAKSGAFTIRVASLRDYGLITSTKDAVSITDLGVKISKPVTDLERENAIRQAFLSVTPFKNLYEGLEHEVELPLDQVKQYAVFTLGVSRESMDKFIGVFIDSGRFVGLVSYSKESSTITLQKIETAQPVVQDKSTVDEQASKNQGAESAVSEPNLLMTTPTIAAHSQALAGVTTSTEQGVNHSGNGWTLTVILKTSVRLDAPTRKKVRDLLELADEVSDELHSLDEKLIPLGLDNE